MMRLLFLFLLAGCGSLSETGLITGRTRVIAHRGGTGPDGTIAGCRRTLATGVVFLELDVRLTRDGQAVILHDPTVDRTTDGKGPVAQMTLEELRRLDAGSRFDRAYAGERVPTVAELLRAVGGPGVVLLELKVPEAAGPVVDAIRATGTFEHAIIRSADAETLARIREAEPRALLGTMGALPREIDDVRTLALRLHAVGVSAFTARLDPHLTRQAVERLQEAGVAVWGTNTNDEAEMRRWIALGADGVMTDRPDLLASLLR